MDPDANLEEQLLRASKLVEAIENDRGIRESEVLRLAELVIALDEWISNGGFLPGKWGKR